MKSTIFAIAFFLLTCNTPAYCIARESPDTNGNQPDENARIYDNQGKFQGRTVGQGDNVRIYDNKGNFVGRMIPSDDGSSVKLYDNKGNFKGRVVR